MSTLVPDESLRPALLALSRVDADIAKSLEFCGLPPVRRQPQGFAGLLRIMICQQLSVASAAAILGRLSQAMDALAPEGFLDIGEEELRRIGFSRQKIIYGRTLAQAVMGGQLDFAALDRLDDEAAIAYLSRIKGIGRWSSEIYLLFALQRPDVWPAGDLAVRVAFGRLRGLDGPPSEKAMRGAAVEAWRPHRSAAARLLWHLYRHPGVPLA